MDKEDGQRGVKRGWRGKNDLGLEVLRPLSFRYKKNKNKKTLFGRSPHDPSDTK